MIQTPMPPMPPGLDPNFVFNQVTPLITVVVVVLVGATAVRWILRGTPVGEAIAERIRMRAQRRWGGGGSGGGGGGGGTPRAGGGEAGGSPPPGRGGALAQRRGFAGAASARRPRGQRRRGA